MGQNQGADYTIRDQNGESRILTITTNERDLGVQISKDLKPHDKVCKAASKSNRVLGMLKNTFVSRDLELWKRLLPTYFRPNLEYAVQVWNPYAIKDVATLEKVQRRATNIPHLLKHLTYKERLHNLNLTSLEARRERGDLIQLHKIEICINKVNWVEDYERSAPRRIMRGHILKEIVVNCQQRSKFFKNRITNDWNRLPDEITSATSTNSFKNKLDNVQHSYYSSHSTDWVLRAFA